MEFRDWRYSITPVLAYRQADPLITTPACRPPLLKKSRGVKRGEFAKFLMDAGLDGFNLCVSDNFILMGATETDSIRLYTYPVCFLLNSNPNLNGANPLKHNRSNMPGKDLLNLYPLPCP